MKTHDLFGLARAMKGLLLIVGVLAFAGCGFLMREARVTDVTKSETLVLRNAGSGPVSSIRIMGRGSINGKAEVQLILNGAVYKKEELSGRVGFEWSGDWYAHEAEVRYLPGTATGGTLKLGYKIQ